MNFPWLDSRTAAVLSEIARTQRLLQASRWSIIVRIAFDHDLGASRFGKILFSILDLSQFIVVRVVCRALFYWARFNSCVAVDLLDDILKEKSKCNTILRRNALRGP